jgi:phospholipid transport system substrate-binding protein
MRILKLSMVFGIWMLMSMHCWAADSGPVQMLRGVTNQVMNELKANKESLANDTNALYGLVNRFIVPHADFTEMGKWVVGRNAWQSADAATQQSFVNEFQTLVVRSYAGALLAYTDQEVVFLPLRDQAEKQRVQVSTLIKDGEQKPLHIDYRVLKVGNEWKVYDIIIEGVGLMQGYRAQFANEVQQGGLKAVTAKIRQHNQRGSQ